MSVTAAELMIRYGGDASGAVRASHTAERSMDRVDNSARRSGVGVGMLARGVGILGTALGGAGLASVYMGGQLEQAEVAFKTLLGSATKATSFLKDLTDFAARTPFELTGLQDSSRKLLAFGFEAKEIIPMMTDIGDAVGSLGLGQEGMDRVTIALGQMQAKSKVSAEEMMQLAESGIPAWQMLADAIGTSVPEAMKLAEEGSISGAEGIEAVLAGMRDQFAGGMEKQSKTLLGRLSNFKDVAVQFASKMGQELTKTFDLKNKVKGATEWLASLKEPTLAFMKMWRREGFAAAIADTDTAVGNLASNPAFKEWMSDAGSGAKSLASRLGDVARTLGPMAVDLGRFATEHKGLTATVVGGAVAAKTADNVFGGLWKRIADLTKIVVVGKLGMLAFHQVLGLDPKAVLGWKLLPRLFDNARTALGAMGKGLLFVARSAIGALVKAVTGLFTLIMAHPFVAIGVAVAALIFLIIRHWDKVKAFLGRTWDWIKQVGKGIWDGLMNATGEVIAFVLKGWRMFVEIFFGIAGKIVDAAAWAFGWVPGLGGKIKDAQKKFHEFTGGVLDGLDRQINRFEGWGKATRGEIRGAINTWGEFQTAVEKKILPPTAAFHFVPDNVGGGVGAGDLGNSLTSIGRSLLGQGFRVSGHSAFGGMPSSGHSAGSYHYVDRAIDINWGPGGKSPEEQSVLIGLAAKLQATLGGRILELLHPGNDPDHDDHLHLAMYKGGWINEPVFGRGAWSGMSYSFGERGSERVLSSSESGSMRSLVMVRGTLSLDRDGRAYISGLARAEDEAESRYSASRARAKA